MMTVRKKVSVSRMTRTDTAANTGPFKSLNKKVASKAKSELPRKRHTTLLDELLLTTLCCSSKFYQRTTKVLWRKVYCAIYFTRAHPQKSSLCARQVPAPCPTDESAQYCCLNSLSAQQSISWPLPSASAWRKCLALFGFI